MSTNSNSIKINYWWLNRFMLIFFFNGGVILTPSDPVSLVVADVKSDGVSRIWIINFVENWMQQRAATDLSMPSDWQMNLANQRPLTSTPPQTANKTCGHVILENNSGALWGCADRTLTSNLRSVYFACLGGQSYLSPGKRSYHHCFRKQHDHALCLHYNGTLTTCRPF